MTSTGQSISALLTEACLTFNEANKMIEIFERDKRNYPNLGDTRSKFGDATLDAWSDLSNDDREIIKSKHRELLKVNPNINLETVAYYLLIYSKDPKNTSKFKINVSAILANK